MKRYGRALWGLALGTVLAGSSCVPPDQEVINAPEGTLVTNETAVVDDDAAWTLAAVDPLDDSLLFPAAPVATAITVTFNGPTAAGTAAAAAGRYFTPSSCVNATADGAVATYVLNGCSGPLGLKNVTGTLTATYSTSGSGPQVVLSGPGISIDGVTYDVHVTATLAQGPGQRIATVTSTTARTANGETRSFAGEVSWVQGSGCAVVTGNGRRALNDTNYNTASSSYTRCTAQCPTSGLVVTQGPNGTATIYLNGSATPTITDASGNTDTVSLSCP